jgi:hypothetical protein
MAKLKGVVRLNISCLPIGILQYILLCISNNIVPAGVVDVVVGAVDVSMVVVPAVVVEVVVDAVVVGAKVEVVVVGGCVVVVPALVEKIGFYWMILLIDLIGSHEYIAI